MTDSVLFLTAAAAFAASATGVWWAVRRDPVDTHYLRLPTSLAPTSPRAADEGSPSFPPRRIPSAPAAAISGAAGALQEAKRRHPSSQAKQLIPGYAHAMATSELLLLASDWVPSDPVRSAIRDRAAQLFAAGD